jgi:hypothetical protein
MDGTMVGRDIARPYVKEQRRGSILAVHARTVSDAGFVSARYGWIDE